MPIEQYKKRVHAEPGTTYKYNDVRVNLLAYAALMVWRRPLPEVLKQYLMDPIGASNTWVWHGYDNSWVKIGGKRMQSVSGGAHWGGGMWISARDLARFGLLTLRRGKWKDRQILSEAWIAQALTPTKPRADLRLHELFPELPRCGRAAPVAWSHAQYVLPHRQRHQRGLRDTRIRSGSGRPLDSRRCVGRVSAAGDRGEQRPVSRTGVAEEVGVARLR